MPGSRKIASGRSWKRDVVVLDRLFHLDRKNLVAAVTLNNSS